MIHVVLHFCSKNLKICFGDRVFGFRWVIVGEYDHLVSYPTKGFQSFQVSSPKFHCIFFFFFRDGQKFCQWKIDFTFSGYFFSFSLCSNFQECQRAASWIGIQNVKRCKFFGPIKCTEILSVAAFELGYNVSKWRDDARRWKGLCPLWDFWISVILWVLRLTQFKFVANLRMWNNSLFVLVETLIWIKILI